MSTAQIEPAGVKADQRASWDAIAAGWAESLEIFERGAAAVTGHLLHAAGVRTGQAVLDVGTGYGEPAVSAARVAGPAGRVVGIDVSPAMLEIARGRPAGPGSAPIEFAEGDVDSTGLPGGAFDAVLSRWAMMFAFDHAAAFREMRRLLVPGGVFAASVWGPPAGAPMIALGYAALGDLLDLPAPPPGMPGPFSMSDPGRVTDELAGAGFEDVAVEEFVVPFRLDSVEEYVAFTKAVLPPALRRRLVDGLGSEDAPAVRDALAEAVEPFGSGDGRLSLPSVSMCLRAVNPADR